MIFSDLVEIFKKLEEISSRNEMISILAKLFKEASDENIDKICYFLLGNIAAAYKHIQLGMDDEMVKSAIALAANIEKQKVSEEMKAIGDLGQVAFRLINRQKKPSNNLLELEDRLTVEGLHKELLRIVTASGPGSHEVKKKRLAALLLAASAEEMQYIVRLATGEMRLGIGDMTILDGLASIFLGLKDKRSALEHAYTVCSDIGHVAKILVRSGIEGVKCIKISLLRPIRPMLAQRVSKMSIIMEKISSAVVAAEENSMEKEFKPTKIRVG